VRARARDAPTRAVEDRDHPVGGDALAQQDLEDRPRVDHRDRDVAELPVDQDRHVHAEVEIGALALARAHRAQVPDHGPDLVRDERETLGVGERGHRSPEREPRVDDRSAVGIGEHDRAPVRLRLDDADRPAVERFRVEPWLQAAHERLEHRGRAAQLRVDGGRERARELDPRAARVVALARDELDQGECGDRADRNERGDRHEEEPAAQRHVPHRAPRGHR
jgi:hypothetical protein